MPDQITIGCKKESPFLTPLDTIERALGQWARVVNAYSAGGLTVPGDKITAISGMADHLRGELGLEYCAGLWRPRMEIQLAWFIKELQPSKSSRNDLAPSWSWASVNGAVEMQEAGYPEGYMISALVSVVNVVVDREAKPRPWRKGRRPVSCLRQPQPCER